MAIQPRILRSLASSALVLALVTGALAQAPGARQAAVVNGEVITLAEVDAILKARPIEGLKLSAAERLEMQKEALNLLIDERIMQQFLRKNAPPAPPAQVNKKLHELQDALKTQGQTLEEYYRETGQTEAQVRASISTALQLTAYLDSRLNEATLRKYYEDNRDIFDQVTVRASHILLRMKPGAPPADREAIQSWLQGIRHDIVSGKVSFAEAARKYSQCVSASKGGDLGFISRQGEVDEVLARTAFALKPQEISEVVQTGSGLHLVQVTERKAGSPSDYQRATAKVRELAGEEILSDLLAQQRMAAQVKVLLEESLPAKPAPARSRFPFGSR
jgi:peptidyl-prolyl cis-trans isomerase C